MNVVLFGATGMVGQGVLHECLLDPEVDKVLALGRSAPGQQHRKLRELVLKDLCDYGSVETELAGFDACFFCLGVASAGMSEASYRRITYDITTAAGSTLARLNPGMTFVYVSGQGTDSSEQGRVMWARVKGQTENALLRMPFKAVYLFRPGAIQPLDGIQSRTKLYRVLYAALGPLWPLIKRLFPNSVTTTEQIGRAMIGVARRGYVKAILDPKDINSVVPLY